MINHGGLDRVQHDRSRINAVPVRRPGGAQRAGSFDLGTNEKGSHSIDTKATKATYLVPGGGRTPTRLPSADFESVFRDLATSWIQPQSVA
jgi:hypothetical protein